MAILLDEIAKDPNAPAAIKAKIGDFKARRKQIREAYAGQMKNMNVAQKEYLVDTEYNADLVGLLLGDEYFIEKLANRNLPLVEKIFKGLKQLVKKNTSSTASGSPSPTGEGIKKSAAVDKASAKYLNKLVNKFGKAIDNAKGGVKISQLGAEDEEKNTVEIENERQSKIKKAKKSYSNAAVNNDILELIQKIEAGKFKQNDTIYLGIVSDAIAEKIEQEIGFSVQGFKMAIEARQLEHIIKDHGENGKTDHSMKNPNDIGKMEYVLDNAESIIKSGKTQAYTYMKYGWNRTADTVLYEKIIGDESYYVVQAVPDTKARTLYVVSAFIGKSGYKKEAPQLINAKGPDATANTGSASASNSSISENSKKINTFDKKIDDERKSISKLVDSEGNSLSAEQAEYFKDSKVRDADGKLLVVYHGSQAVFTEFKHKYINLHGSQEGRGFYFTDNAKMAQGYERDGGQLLKGYVNISKPLSDTELTLTRKEVASLIKAIDPTGDDLIANYDTGGGMGYPSRAWYNRAFNDTLDAVMNYCDTDSEVLAELRNAGADEEILLKTVRRTLGYDGYITSEKYENAQVFVAFESNQFKNADNTAPTDNLDIRYSKSKNSFSEQVDDVLDGKDTSSTHLYVMDTPSLLQEAGLPSLPILLTAKHLKSITAKSGSGSANYHGLDKEIVKKLPEYIADPVMMADSFTRNDSVVIVTEAIDTQNRPVIAAIMLNGNGRLEKKHIDANIITSAYGRNNFQNFVDRLAENDAVFYWNNKKSQAMSVSLGIQFPNAITKLDSNTIIRKAKAFVNKNSEKISNERFSKSKSERFMPARHTKMIQAEELVKGYDEGTLTDADALKRLNILGFVTGISKDNALEMLEELMPDIRDFATSERAAYRESNKKDTSSVAKATPSPQGKGYKGAEDEENFRNLVENDPAEIKYRAAEWERKESEESLLNEGDKARETTTEFDEPEMSNEERRLMASAERVASGKDFFPRHAEMRPSNDESWDYWLNEIDRREGSVRKLKNGKIKVGMAQTANEVKLTKFINNKIMDKAYSNENVKSVIDKILSNSDIWGADESGAYIAKLKGADLITVKKRLWAALNTAPEGERIGPALDIADFIVTHGMIEETVEITEDVINAQYIIDTLEPYKRKIDISHIKGDIEAVFDTDRSPFGLWAQKKSDTSRPFTADEVGQALEDAGIMLGGERGKLINEADIFIAMHKRYTEAQAIIKAATPTKNDIIGAYDAKEAYEIKQKIAREILRSYDEYGKETSFARLEKKFRGEIASLKKRVSEVYELNRAKNEMLYQAGRLQDKKKGKFHNATQAQNEALNGIISVLSKLKYRSDINKSSSRALLDELAKWYTEDNPLLRGGAVDKKTSEFKGFYSPYIKELIDYFRLDEASVNDKYFENKRKILEMEPTFAVSGNEFVKGEVDLFTQVNDYFKTFNNQVHNEEIGDVIIDRRGIKDDVAHGIGRKKAATFAAVPDVIKNGKVVDYQTNWKNRGYDTAVIAAPITIAGEKHYMGVVVIQNKENNRFYVHEVVEIKKEGAQPFKTGLAEKNSNAGGDTPSVISILQDLAKINTLNENNAELSLDELHAINKILAHMNFVVENFGKIWRHGKWVEAKDVAEKDLEIFKSAVGNQTVITRLIGNKFTVIILFYSTGQKSCVFSL